MYLKLNIDIEALKIKKLKRKQQQRKILAHNTNTYI